MTTTETRRGGRKPIKLLGEKHELELIRAYITGDQSIKALAHSFGVPETYPYRILNRYDIAWRRDWDVSFIDWARQAKRPDLIDTLKLEATLDLKPTVVPASTPAAIPVTLDQRTEPDQQQVVAERPVPDLPLFLSGPPVEWVVELTERISVNASSIEGALDEARKLRRNGRITGIRMRETDR